MKGYFQVVKLPLDLRAYRSIGLVCLALGLSACHQQTSIEDAHKPLLSANETTDSLPTDAVQVDAAVLLAEPSAEALAKPFAEHGLPRSITSLAVPTQQPGRFISYVPNGSRVAAETPVSTFSIDVDTASYATLRQHINLGLLPQRNSIRVEELVNYFNYNYPLPNINDAPFSLHTELAPSPYNQEATLLRIGVQGYKLMPEQIKARNLVFLIDVSGSMSSADKLPLLKQALMLLSSGLNAQDKISIVVYADGVRQVLDGVNGNAVQQIQQGLNSLEAGGGTNGGKGLALAYELAQKHFIEHGVNQVLLATDGDFNLGMSNHTELVNYVVQQRQSGVGLTTLGFGLGAATAQFNDGLLAQLAAKANGQYAYIDTLNEARKVLHDQLSQTLDIIAADVKIQIEFNPAIVAEYRLIGYESRQLHRQDFTNDKVDAAEIGAGQSVTALYELRYNQSTQLMNPPLRYKTTEVGKQPGALSQRQQFDSDEIAFLSLRYKPFHGGLLAASKSQLISQAILASSEHKHLQQASDDFRFAAAVAGFGQLVNHNHYVHNIDYDKLINLAAGAMANDPFGYRHEFLQLMRTTQLLVAQGTPQHGGFYDDADQRQYLQKAADGTYPMPKPITHGEQ
ncbi:vWA domain-containing protein [Shewanella subflava]|uniref:von Willebrand factor type A domain-containing protein n=1 Tax=Shewanella subflava TaxID=2986476 RepID=A0ABT3I883_9GAMM|nr:von Willebrand factor type A domain-containing protein [Shewanella subflava]MCW3172271.1 von Willebrand factor type A domain-containing protein [Shewanella subflava]